MTARSLPAGVIVLVLLLVLALTALLWLRDDEPAPPPVHIQQVGIVTAKAVTEASALVKSRKHPGVFWTLCDAHNPPRLYAIGETGKLLATLRLRGAKNTDWEALAMDERGRLYVGDIGNNPRNTSVRTIYQLDEPAQLPADPETLVTVPVTAEFHFNYPGRPFDAEAMVVQDDTLFVITKSKERGESVLFRRALSSGVLEYVGTLPPELTFIADASLSPDRRRLALANKDYTAIVDLPNGRVTDLLTATPKIYRYRLHKIEGCTWDGPDVVLIDENRKVYRLTP